MFLNNINLDVKPGEYIAFVGSSGVGKTTICSLIPRFYEATKGNVLIDGINVKEIKQQSLREKYWGLFNKMFTYLQEPSWIIFVMEI